MGLKRRISGTIIDNTSSAPQSGVTVRLWATRNAGQGRMQVGESVTNTKGRFSIDISTAALRRAQGIFSIEVWAESSQLVATGDTRWPVSRDGHALVIAVSAPSGVAWSESLPEGVNIPTTGIYGLVCHTDGTAIDGLTVSLHHVGFTPVSEGQSDVVLDDQGQPFTTTTVEGWYAFDLGALSQPLSSSSHFQVRAGDSTVVGRSRVAFGLATGVRQLNISVSDDAYRARSEFEHISADLSEAVLGGAGGGGEGALNSALGGEVSLRQVAWASGCSGWHIDKVGHRTLAARLSAELGTEENPVSTEALYALLRAGLPASGRGILSQPAARLGAALRRGQRANLVSATLDVDEVLNSLIAARGNLLDEEEDDSLGTILRCSQEPGQSASLTDTQIAEFCMFYASYDGDVAGMWEQAASLTHFDPASIAVAQRMIQLGTMALGHAPCVKAILAALGNDAPEVIATWESAQWEAIAGVSSDPAIPPVAPLPVGLDGDTEAEQRAALAALLIEQARLAFPRSARWHRLTSEGSLGEGLSLKAPLESLVGASGGVDPFDLVHDTLTTSLLATLSAEDGALLQKAQRLLRLCPPTRDVEALHTLMETLNLRSAAQVVRLGRQRFTELYATDGGAERSDEAMGIFQRAQSQHAMASAFFLQAHPALGPARLRFIGEAEAPSTAAAIPGWSTATAQSATKVDWSSSVHGPAAYLVDLLHWLDQKKRPLVSSQTALDMLLERRPDLATLPLTAENTLRQLPLTDLAFEVMEAAVTGEAPIRSSEVDTAEQFAGAQYTQAAAYGAGALGDEVRSFRGPFHQPLAEARAFLAHLNIQRADLIHTFAEAGAAPLSICLEELGLSVEAAAAITTAPTTGGTEESWWPIGLTSPVDLESFQRATGLRHPELLDLLHSLAANPSGVGEVGRLDLRKTADDPYDIGSYELQEYTGSAWDVPTQAAWTRLRQVIRLWRATGWSLPDLDRVLATCGLLPTTSWSDETVRFVGGLRRLERRTGLSPLEVAACFGSLSTRADRDTTDTLRPSHFEQTFERSSLFARSEQEQTEEEGGSTYRTFPFALNANRDEIESSRTSTWTDTLAAHSAPVQAVLGIDERELLRLIEGLEDLGALLGSGTPTGLLRLINLARLDRWTKVARVLGIRPTEALRLAVLMGKGPAGEAGVVSGEGPFASPAELDAFIGVSRALLAAGWTVDALDWLVRHETVNPVGPADSLSQRVLGQIRDLVSTPEGANSDALRQQVTEKLATSLGLSQRVIAHLDGRMWLGAAIDERVGSSSLAAWGAIVPLSLHSTVVGPDGVTIELDGTASLDPSGTIESGVTVTVPPGTLLSIADMQVLLAAGASVTVSGTADSPTLSFSGDGAIVSGAVTVPSGTLVTWDGGASSGTLLSEATGPLVGSMDVTGLACGPCSPDQVGSPSIIGAFLMSRFATPPSVRSDPPWSDITRDSCPTQYAILDGLYKVALLLSHLGVADEEYAALHQTASSWGALQPCQLLSGPLSLRGLSLRDGFAALLASIRLFGARSRLPGTRPTFADLLSAPTDTNLATRTGWSEDDISFLIDLPDGALSSADALVALLDRMDTCHRVGATPNVVSTWAADGDLTSFTPAVARSVIAATRSRHPSPEAWLSVAGQIRETLRRQMREALVDYHIATSAEGLQDADQLYEHFLIDVSANPPVRTSRVVQAANSVQLFVHRALLGLEAGASNLFDDDDRAEWEWMRTYRVWEAARKVFLYPENWIEPELRDDKTPFFREAEQALGQGDVTEDAVEEVTLEYLESLHGVASLQVMACHVEQESDADGAIDRLHVFARTRATPPTWWYRCRDDGTTWSPWEKVEAGIQGDHLLPVVYNRRLLLFWAELSQIAASTTDDAEPTPYWEVRLAMSERRRGHWEAKRLATDSFPASSDGTEVMAVEPEAICLVSSQVDGLQVHLLVADWYKKEATSAMTREWIYISSMALNPCTMEMQPEEANSSRIDRAGLSSARWRAPGLQCHEELSVTVGDFDPDSGDATGESQALTLLRSITGATMVVPGQWFDFVGQSPFFVDAGDKVWLVEPVTPGDRELSFIELSPGGDVKSLTAFRRGTRARASAAGAGELAEADAAEIMELLAPDHHRSSLQAMNDLNVMSSELAGDVWEGQLTGSPVGFRFTAFYHPYVCRFIKEVRRNGVFGLLNPSPSGTGRDLFRQAVAGDADEFQQWYSPTANVLGDYPVENIDFALSGAYSAYNWELFFHLPFYLATQLSDAGRFAESLDWLHTIFDPRTRTSVSSAGIDGAVDSAGWWKIKPFLLPASAPVTDWLAFSGADGDADAQDAFERQVAAWREDPFNPHHLARLRPGTYQRAVVMRYIDTLLDWGDHLFGKDTMESLNEATQLYVFARQVLGGRPVLLEASTRPADFSFEDLRDQLDDFGNAIVAIENAGFAARGRGRSVFQPRLGLCATLGHTTAFGVPFNARLLSYWDTVDDRLFKIRNGMNIDGVVRSLPLFQPPIDPALLVRAAASGVDFTTVVEAADLPLHRFAVLHARATGVAATVRALGGALLSALEKKDGEALGRLRQEQERALLDLVGQVKGQQVAEAMAAKEAAHLSRTMAQARWKYYDRLIEKGWSAKEEESNKLTIRGIFLQDTAGAFSALAADSAVVGEKYLTKPWAKYGGYKLHRIFSALATVASTSASHLHARASRLTTAASYYRRGQEWRHQRKQAEKELAQLDQQIAAATIRVEIAQKELTNHQTQVEHSQQVLDFMQAKFTNGELYQWMARELASLHFQQFQLALSLARKAEASYNFELARSDSFVQPIYWDGIRKGLLAGERLGADLERMDAAYLDNEIREVELTKRISLQRLDPLVLVLLREQGECYFELPEVLFDLDCPGHYLRRISSVALTVSCVSSGQGQVNVRLDLLSAKIRAVAVGSQGSELVADGYASTTSIVTSTALEDPGVFSSDPNGPRYLPFERRGAVSSWHLAFSNLEYKQLDWNSVSDVTIHLRYTARDEESSRDAVLLNLSTNLDAMAGGYLEAPSSGTPTSSGFVVALSAKRDDPDAWFAAQDAGADEVTLTLGEGRLPYFAVGRFESSGWTVDKIHVVTVGGEPTGLTVAVGSSNESLALSKWPDPLVDEGVRHAATSSTISALTPWPDTITLSDLLGATVGELDDIIIVVEVATA